MHENAEDFEDINLEPSAKALVISVEALKNFSEDTFFNFVANPYNNTSIACSILIARALNYYPTFNPIDKLLKSCEENKKLYELLLETEKEKSKLIEELIHIITKA